MPKEFQGSWCILVILLCFAIVPGIIYYAVMYKEVTPTVVVAPQQQQQQQVVVVQQPIAPQPTVQEKKFCSECGAEVTGKFCNECGAELK